MPYSTRPTLHLAIRQTREIADSLVDDYGLDCPVVVVANAEQPSQVVLRGTLADIADRVEAAGLRQAANILVWRALAREDAAAVESHLYGIRPRPTPAGRGRGQHAHGRGVGRRAVCVGRSVVRTQA